MNKNALAQAIKSLTIVNVYMRDSKITVAESFDNLLGNQVLQVQYKVAPAHSAVLNLSNTDDPNVNASFFRVQVNSEVHLIKPNQEGEDTSTQNKIEIEISANFVADYQIVTQDLPEKSALDEFAINNSPFHIWPYWREFIQSTCARLQISPLVLPMYQAPVVEKSAEHV